MTLSLGFYLYYLGWLLPSKREISPSYFPSLNLPHKQTWWVLLNRIRRTSRSGVSPSQGLPNLFPSRIHKSWRPTLNPQQHHCCLVLCWNQEPGNSYSQQSMQNQIKNYFSPICCLSHSLLLKFGLHSLAIIILNDLHFSTLGLKGGKESIWLMSPGVATLELLGRPQHLSNIQLSQTSSNQKSPNICQHTTPPWLLPTGSQERLTGPLMSWADTTLKYPQLRRSKNFCPTKLSHPAEPSPSHILQSATLQGFAAHMGR